MTKCSEVSERKRSAGSNTCADGDAAAPITASAVTNSALSRLGTRDTREDDAEDQRGQAEETGTDEEESVGVEQWPADAEAFDDDTGEAFRELADIGIRGTQQRVLRGGIADAGQARHV